MRLKTKRKGNKTGMAETAASQDTKASLSDEDKIRLQLLLDVEEFGQALEAIGVNTTQLEPYQALLEMVQQAEKVRPHSFFCFFVFQASSTHLSLSLSL